MQKQKTRISNTEAYSITHRFFFTLTDMKREIQVRHGLVQILIFLSSFQIFAVLFEDIFLFDFPSELKYFVAIMRLDIAYVSGNQISASCVLLGFNFVCLSIFLFQIIFPLKRRLIYLNKLLAIYFISCYSILTSIVMNNLEYVITVELSKNDNNVLSLITKLLPSTINLISMSILTIMFIHFLFRNNFRLGDSILNQSQGWAYFYFFNKLLIHVLHILSQYDSMKKVIYGVSLGVAFTSYALQIVLYFESDFNMRTSYKYQFIKGNLAIASIILAKIAVLANLLSNDIVYFVVTVLFISASLFLLFRLRADSFISRLTTTINLGERFESTKFKRLFGSLLFGVNGRYLDQKFYKYLEHVSTLMDEPINSMTFDSRNHRQIFLKLASKYIQKHFTKEYDFILLYTLMGIKLETEKVSYKMIGEFLNILEGTRSMKETYLVVELIRELQTNIRNHTNQEKDVSKSHELNTMEFQEEFSEITHLLLLYMSLEIRISDCLMKSPRTLKSQELLFGKLKRKVIRAQKADKPLI